MSPQRKSTPRSVLPVISHDYVLGDRNRERSALRAVGTTAGMSGKQERTLQVSCLVTIAVTGKPANAATLPSAQVIKYELKNQFLGAAGDIKNSQKFNSANVRTRRTDNINVGVHGMSCAERGTIQ